MNIKKLVFLPLLLVASLAMPQATVKMSMNMSGLDMGTALLSIKPTSDGGLTTNFDLKVAANGQVGSGKIQSVHTKTGRPKLAHHNMKFGPLSQSRKETYTATHLIIEEVENGKKTTKKFALPKGKSLDDPSNFWFWKTKPKVGAVVKTWSFDDDQKKFVQQTTKYVGLKTITVGGKKVSAHHIEHAEGEAWVDNKGMPLRLVMASKGMEMVFERIWN